MSPRSVEIHSVYSVPYEAIIKNKVTGNFLPSRMNLIADAAKILGVDGRRREDGGEAGEEEELPKCKSACEVPEFVWKLAALVLLVIILAQESLNSSLLARFQCKCVNGTAATGHE